MNIVITGANRGIGLALTKAYISAGHTVFALCRHSSDGLSASGAKVITGIDVSKHESLSEKLKDVASAGIDLLINNAGVLANESLSDLNPHTIDYQFRVNAMGPLMLTHALIPALNKDARVAMITSRMGSMQDNGSGGYYGYRMSKAALNAASVSLARDLAPKGIAVGIFHPGFVQTDMVNGNGDIDADTAAQRLVSRIDELSMESTGQFVHSNGDALPW